MLLHAAAVFSPLTSSREARLAKLSVRYPSESRAAPMSF